MSWAAQISLLRGWRRIVFRCRRAQLERELDEELELHQQLRARDNKRAGLQAAEAIELSRRQMGNLTLAKEESRAMWSFLSFERFFQDMGYAMRMFLRTPVFTSVAVLSLALGIGGNTAMFSLVNALLIRPLPYAEPDKLVRVTGIFPRAAIPFFREQSRTFEIASVSPGSESNLTGAGPARRITGSQASANFLPLLGASVSRGRGFQPGEDLPGRDGVAVVSHALWQEQFGGDPSIIGRVIKLDEVNREIVGILPKDFSYPSAKVQIWVPMRLDPKNFVEYWGTQFMPIVARLRPGATIEQARGEVSSLVSRFRGTFPYVMARSWNADSTVIPLQQDIVGNVRGKLILLLSSVGIVLLIACANVASLLLSRATTRRKEIALRAALGANRSRIIRQLLTESMALALCGAVLGIGLGMGALSIFKALLPSALPGLAEASIDWQIVAAVTILALLTGLAFGLAPAWNAAQVDLAETIKTGGQRSIASHWTRFRSCLIAAEVALTLVLVVSAGLLLKSLYRLAETNPGFNPARILSVRVTPTQSSCAQRANCIALYDRLLMRARALPGVTEAAVANSAPLDGRFPAIPVDVEGHPKTVDYPSPMLWAGAASSAYLRMMQIPLLVGRQFSDTDTATSAPVALISAATAKLFWPGESAIGKHMKVAGNQDWRTIVGVVGDVRQFRLNQPLPPGVVGAIYMPYAQSEQTGGQIPAAMTLLVKTNIDTSRLRNELWQLAKDQDTNVPVGPVLTLGSVVFDSIADFRSTMRVFVSFAAVAMVLAAIGIYGLMSYWVGQRTYEIGLRVAIGATRSGILAMFLRQGLRVSFYGITVGIVVAVLLTRALAGLLYGVAPTDMFTFVMVTALILAVAALATAFPAYRASRIDPVRSLRVD